METMGLDKHVDFIEECSGVFGVLSNAYGQLNKKGEVNEDIVKYMESRMLYISQFKHLNPNEEWIKKRLINAMDSLIELNYMVSSLNEIKMDIDMIEGNPKIDKIKSRVLIGLIMELTNEYCNEEGKIGIPIDLIITEMEKRYKLSEEEVKSILSKLKSSGTVFEPQHNLIKIVRI